MLNDLLSKMIDLRQQKIREKKKKPLPYRY